MEIKIENVFEDGCWFKLDKTPVVNLKKDLLSCFRGNDEIVAVGCDSQIHDHKHEYVVAIVIYTPGKGGTTFHRKFFTEQSRSLREKLVNEAWLSIQVCWEVEKILPKNIDLSVHLDVNPDENWASSRYHDELYWLTRGQGFKVFTKPNAWVASYVSEHICKHRNEAA
jgi:predicted RNase H-related nuclease YkuK (DUF458 family)